MLEFTVATRTNEVRIEGYLVKGVVFTPFINDIAIARRFSSACIRQFDTLDEASEAAWHFARIHGACIGTVYA